MLPALPAHIGKHARIYAIAIFMWLQAFGTGFYDNFWPIEPENMAKLGWWQLVAAFLKSNSFAVGMVLGFLLKSGPADKAEAAKEDPAPTPVTPPPPGDNFAKLS